MSALVIRWSSLGDVVLAGSVTGGLGDVWFWTKPAWRDLAARLPGVQRVLVWGEDPAPKGQNFTRIVDLQGDLRSRRATLGLRGPVHRLARHDLRRRTRVWLKWGAPPPTVVERYAAAAGVPVAPRPWLDLGPPGEALALIPGASRATKRWPLARWRDLAEAWEGPLVLLGGPEDQALLHALGEGLGPRVEVVAEAGFEATLAALGRCRAAVGGDTGLLHLAAAAGRPVVGIFGPTTSADGFWCHPGEAVELDLPCRPCSRYGSMRCPMGDHACMQQLSPVQVQAALARALSGAQP